MNSYSDKCVRCCAWQTTLRSTLGQHSLDELLSERDKINVILQRIIDDQTAEIAEMEEKR